MSRTLSFSFGLVSLLLSNAALAQEASYLLTPFGVQPLGRSEGGAARERLPKGVTGALPAEDGGLFALEVADGLYPAGSTEEVQRALDEILPAVGYEGSARELWPAHESPGDPRIAKARPARVLTGPNEPPLSSYRPRWRPSRLQMIGPR